MKQTTSPIEHGSRPRRRTRRTPAECYDPATDPPPQPVAPASPPPTGARVTASGPARVVNQSAPSSPPVPSLWSWVRAHSSPIIAVGTMVLALFAVLGFFVSFMRGFEDRLNERMDQRFEGIEQRFEGIEQRLTNLEAEVRILRQELNQVKDELNRVKDDLSQVKDNLADLREEVALIRGVVVGIEAPPEQAESRSGDQEGEPATLTPRRTSGVRTTTVAE